MFSIYKDSNYWFIYNKDSFYKVVNNSNGVTN